MLAARPFRRPLPAAVPALLLTLLAAAGAAAALEVAAAGPPPRELSAEMRAALAGEGARAGEGFEIWLRREPGLATGGSGGLGAAFGTLGEGALVGALRLSAGWRDYRGQSVPAGVYTLRFALLPEDGYHMGVSTYRDYLLLVPAAEDPDPAATLGFDRLVALARESSGTRHPAVLSLVPAGEVEAPAATESDQGQPVLALPFGELTLGLVVAGTGEV